MYTQTHSPLRLGTLGLALAALTGAASATDEPATSARVEVQGTVAGKLEAVNFHGRARVSSRLIRDPDFGAPPSAEVTIDLRGVSGVGAASGAKYATRAREVLNIGLTDDGEGQVEVDFPYQSTAAKTKSARAVGVGHARFQFLFNLADGGIVAANGAIESSAALAAESQ